MGKTPVVGLVGLFLVGMAATGCDSGRPNNKYRQNSTLSNPTGKDVSPIVGKDAPPIGDRPPDRFVTPPSPTPPARLPEGTATSPGGLGGSPVGTAGFGSMGASPVSRPLDVARPVVGGASTGMNAPALGSDGLGNRLPTQDQSLSVARPGAGSLPPLPLMRGGETVMSPSVPAPMLGGTALPGAPLPTVSGTPPITSSTTLPPVSALPASSNFGGGGTMLPPPPPPAQESWGTGSK